MKTPDLFDRQSFAEKFTRAGQSIVPPQPDEIARAKSIGPALDDVSDHAPYQPHSQESFAAAQAILPNANTLRRKVYDHILGAGARGATDDEIQFALGMNPSTQRPRRVELVEQGLIVKSKSMTRKTRSGRGAAVWLALPGGEA